MDDFDLTQRGALPTLFERARTRFLLISFTSDWLYPSYQSLEIVSALRSRNCDVAYCNLEARYGHDSFLVEVEEQTELVRGFLASTFREAAALKRRPRRRLEDRMGVREVYGRRDFRHHRRVGGTGDARARSGLRRRRTAGVAEGAQERRRPRRGIDRSAGAEGHRARRVGVSGRSRIGGGGLSRPALSTT